MSKFHHSKLPYFSTILSGREIKDEYGFESENIQIWYNNSILEWKDNKSHAHKNSDECFIITKGKVGIEVEGEIHTINAGEYCCFPKGLYHSIIKVYPPIESFMIRAPSIEDKIYKE